MNVWSRVLTALRGEINGGQESVVDNLTLQILDQEIGDASEQLNQSKQNLAEMMVKHALIQQQCQKIPLKIKEYEDYILKAVQQENDDLALELAGKISELEGQLAGELELDRYYVASVDKLKIAMMQTERDIKLLKQQLDTVKATASVQKAQAAVAKRYGGSNAKLRTATDSLQLIKQKQALKDAQIVAARELAGDNDTAVLLQKLKRAGISTDLSKAENILQKIKEKPAT